MSIPHPPSHTARRRGRPKAAKSNEQETTLQTLDRAMTVLRTIAAQGKVSLSQLVEALDIPVASVYRILFTLQQQQFVHFDDVSQRWQIGMEAFRTGSSFLSQNSLIDSARSSMWLLMQKTGETVNLSIPEDGHIVFVNQVESQHPIRAFFQPGTRAVMHATGSGKAILATYAPQTVEDIVYQVGLKNFTAYTLTSMTQLHHDLNVIRHRGWSFDNEEHFIGMSCIGAAIFNAQAEAIAGVSVSGPSSRFRGDCHAALSHAVMTAARCITDAVGGQMPALPLIPE